MVSLLIASLLLAGQQEKVISCDLLVVGGNESAVAAAVQASRLGVPKVLLVSDIPWLGGQFSSEGVGNVDEWTTVNGKRTDFPRSGMFLEVARFIEKINLAKHGHKAPGNSFCARLTIEPAEAAKIFESLVEPEVQSGRLQIERGWSVLSSEVRQNSITGVVFEKGQEKLRVTSRLTIDASDWGDVIRTSNTKWSAGPDSKSRFGEPSAPENITDINRNEMNPITYCVVAKGSANPKPIPKPANYDERRYYGISKETRKQFAETAWPKGVLFMGVSAFEDTTHAAGPYSPPVNIYTHRRLVDSMHLNMPFEKEKLFFNWPVQDYPLDVWPKHVAEALEANEKGASKKALPGLTPSQRAIVFADAKNHALGMFYFLQQRYPQFARLELTDEFGTLDNLPWKPYVREGLRLEAVTMLKEQDLRTKQSEPKWARLMSADGLFGFQFNIDFHPTRRQFLNNDPSQPWATIHTPTRNWSTHTDRSMFPAAALVPLEMDSLLGASKNIGVSSIVSSAIRLHGQMMLCGQASATLAWACLIQNKQPRELLKDLEQIRNVQKVLVKGKDGPGVLLWPYHDVPPEHPAFEAINLLSVKGIWRPEADSIFFKPDEPISQEVWIQLLEKVPAAKGPTPKSRGDAALAVYKVLSP